MPTPRLSRDAREFIDQVGHKQAKQLLVKIIELCSEPNPPDSSALRGNMSTYRRVDVGEFRIIYKVVEQDLNIPLIGRRNDDEVYKTFERKQKD